MKRIHKPKVQKERFFDSKENIIKVCAAAAVVVLLVVVLMIVESGYGKIVIKNKTNLKLEYVKTSYVGPESVTAEGIETSVIEVNKTFSQKLEPVNLSYTSSNLEIHFKFENQEELFTDVGFFNDKFDGNVTISFENTDDPNLITMKVKAKNGIFKTRSIDCDEEYTIDLSEGGIYQ